MDYKKLYLQKKKEYKKNKNIITGGGKKNLSGKAKSEKKLSAKTKSEKNEIIKHIAILESKFGELYLKYTTIFIYIIKNIIREELEHITDYKKQFDDAHTKYIDASEKLENIMSKTIIDEDDKTEFRKNINKSNENVDFIVENFNRIVNNPQELFAGLADITKENINLRKYLFEEQNIIDEYQKKKSSYLSDDNIQFFEEMKARVLEIQQMYEKNVTTYYRLWDSLGIGRTSAIRTHEELKSILPNKKEINFIHLILNGIEEILKEVLIKKEI